MNDLNQWVSSNKAWLMARAQEVRERPEAWTRHAYARDSSGTPCEPKSTLAECWCVEGFLQRDGFGNSDVISALSSIYPARLLRTVNDSLIRSPEQLCEWLTRAAEVAHQFTSKGEWLLAQARRYCELDSYLGSNDTHSDYLN